MEHAPSMMTVPLPVRWHSRTQRWLAIVFYESILINTPLSYKACPTSRCSVKFRNSGNSNSRDFRISIDLGISVSAEIFWIDSNRVAPTLELSVHGIFFYHLRISTPPLHRSCRFVQLARATNFRSMVGSSNKFILKTISDRNRWLSFCTYIWPSAIDS